ncbi:hypothetical protein [Crocosphaera sp. Alani8]|uniref:hypothetical protein n=1 Tax=Crocosphaera sp. Alani8 TaxID=3038952 RepID=UPI00313B4AFA
MQFIPSQHGFTFPNGFRGYALPKFIRNRKENWLLNQNKVLHGLCGGMCFGAYDFFLSNQKIPILKEAPAPTDQLYEYLYKRQNDSYGYCNYNILKFAQWMGLSKQEIQKRMNIELRKLLSQLDKQNLVILGLITVKLSESLAIWKNHQVLAYSYNLSQSFNNSHYEISIYDPNLNRENNVILKTNIDPNFDCVLLNQDDQKYLRTIYGFFIIPYSYVKPPSFQLI